MDVSQPYAGYKLKDELARYCLPGAKRDPNRKLAWANSVCILFLAVGVFGARQQSITIRTPPPMEEIIPTMMEPVAPPPTTATQQKQEPTDEDKPDIPQVVVVTPNSPAINFSVPTIGNLVVPNAIAAAPPAEPMRELAPVRSRPTVLNSTGKGGDRPEPPYPKLWQQEGVQGTVVLAITVDATGMVTSIQLKESSGYPMLDRSTLDHVKRHWIFPPGSGTRLYEAPIRFVLQ